MRMDIKSDHVVRTITALIEGGPILNNDWATWRRSPRPFKLATLVVTSDGSKISDVLITGPLVLKGGRFSQSQTDELRLYPKDLESAPPWLRTLILDVVSNVKGANYPDPAGGTVENPIPVGH